MINTKKCQKYNKNTSGMLAQSVKVELLSHDEECVVSARFNDFMEYHDLGCAPITTTELKELLKILA